MVHAIINVHNTFLDYKGMLVKYMSKIGKDLNSLGKAELDLLSTCCDICLLDEANQILFMAYILKNWEAYAMDIIDGDYKYVNYTSTIYREFAKRIVH